MGLRATCAVGVAACDCSACYTALPYKTQLRNALRQTLVFPAAVFEGLFFLSVVHLG